MDQPKDENHRLPTVFLTGTAGVGKSIVAKEIHELLRRADRPNAMIDLDAFGRAYPPIDPPLNATFVVNNLRALWPNYRVLDLNHLVMARVLASRAELDAYRSLPGIDLHVVRLTAAADTVRARIRQREPGISQGFLLDLAEQLDDDVTTSLDNEIVIANDADRNVTDVAVEVLRRLGWPVPGSIDG